MHKAGECKCRGRQRNGARTREEKPKARHINLLLNERGLQRQEVLDLDPGFSTSQMDDPGQVP